MIEPIIHQIWVGPNRIPRRERGFMYRLRLGHLNFTYRLWTDRNLPPMADAVRERFDWRMSQGEYAFASDILRCVVLHMYGGIYFDVDVEPRHGMHGLDLDGIDAWFHHQYAGDWTLSNDCFGLAKGHPLGAKMLASMVAPEYAFGPHWMGKQVREYVGSTIDADHDTVRFRCSAHRILYMPSHRSHPGGSQHEVWEKRFYHHCLFSWHPENSKRLAEGNYD